jgi:hypothetical protein
MASIRISIIFFVQFVGTFVLAQNSTNFTYNPLQYVDQLIGSANGGI